MKKPTFTNLTKEQSDYIEFLERLQGSNIMKLIQAIDNMSGIVADDILILSSGGTDEEIDEKLKILGSKTKETYRRYLDVVASAKHYKNVQDILAELKPVLQGEEEKEEQQGKKLRKITGNMFEEISAKVKERSNGNS